MGKLIQNINDVTEKCFGTEVESLEHDVYKYTDCGAWIKWDEDGVTIGSIVEGSDAEFDRRFEYPFDSDEIDHWLDELEELCEEAWREANLNELRIELGNGGYLCIKTDAETYEDAKLDFYGALVKAGIDYSLKEVSWLLLDPWGNEIEEE